MKPERLSRTVAYESSRFNVYLDKVRFPNGRVIDGFRLLDFPRASVVAIVENDEGNVVLVRICRYTTGATEWELPAGGLEIEESITDAARREVLEETGYASHSHRLIYSYHPMSGSANKLFHIVHCRGGESVQAFDRNEVSEIRWFTRDELRRLITDRAITDGFTLTAVLLWLQG
jgi:ADP-ribose pyrophosphatase